MTQLDDAGGIVPGGDDRDDRDDRDLGTGDDLDVRRRGRTGLIVSVVVALVAAGLVWVLATREPGTDREAASPLVGRPAPPLAGETLDGGSFDIRDHRGQWVVVNAFATWCVPCQQEHPQLVQFDEAHRGTGDAQLVSVLYDDEPADGRAYFERNGGEWPVVIDSLMFPPRWGVSGVPETFVVAPDGRVAVKLIGGVTQDGLERVIDDLQAAGGTDTHAGSGAAGDAGGEAP